MNSTTRIILAATLAAAVLPLPGAAQQRNRSAANTQRCQPGESARTGRTTAESPPQQGEYDVVLDIPDLCVDEIQLDVQNLEAHLALNARVANLVNVDAGADVAIGNVSLGIRGVRAQALLLIDLDNIVFVIDRTLQFIDENPQLVTGLFRTTQGALTTVGGLGETALQPGGVVDNAVGTVGRTLENVTAPNGLLSQTVNTLNQTVQRVVTSAGSIVERTVDSAGNLVGSERTLGTVTSLPVVSETTNSAGQLVRQVRDSSGRVIEYVAGQGGRITGVRVVP
jgi:hypothetical protein